MSSKTQANQLEQVSSPKETVVFGSLLSFKGRSALKVSPQVF